MDCEVLHCKMRVYEGSCITITSRRAVILTHAQACACKVLRTPFVWRQQVFSPTRISSCGPSQAIRETNNRHEETRTPDLYRVKAARTGRSTTYTGYGNCQAPVSTCKYVQNPGKLGWS